MPPSVRAPVVVLLTALGLVLVGPGEGRAQRIAVTVDSTASVIDYTGSATAHDWTGTSRSVTGTMVLDLDTPDSSRVAIRAPVASFESGRDRRDRKMREVTEAATYPVVEFRATDVRPVQWGRSNEGHAGRWEVTGDLTFHGQTHPVEAVVDVRTTDDSVRARAQFPVSLTRFDVERPELLWVPIGDTIRIDARLVGAVESAPTRSSDAGAGRQAGPEREDRLGDGRGSGGPLLASAGGRGRTAASLVGDGRVPAPRAEAAGDSSGTEAASDTTRLYEHPMPFSGWKVINLPTGRTLDAGNWLFLIGHRFNRPVNVGYSGFYGLDSGATMYLSLGYAFTDRLLATLARSDREDNVELETRYGIVDEAHPDWPVGVAVQGTVNWITQERGGESRWRSEALKWTGQVSLTHTVAERLGLALVPGLTVNPEETRTGEATLVTLGLGARWRVQEKVAIVGEWTPILARSDRTVTDATRYDTWGAGIEFTTEGHVFQIVVSNNPGLTADQYLGGGDLSGNVFDGEFRLGFNIFRILDFSKF